MFGFEVCLCGRGALRAHKVHCGWWHFSGRAVSLFAFVIFCLLLCLSPVGGSDSPPCGLSSLNALGQGNTTRAKILLLDTTDVHLPFKKSVNAGFFASLFARSCKIRDKYSIEIVTKTTQLDNTGNSVDDAVKENPDVLALAMLYGDTSTMRVLRRLVAHSLVLFSPMTGSSSVRFWNPYLYFVRTSPTAELFALLRYALNILHYRRLGFMYLQGVSFGDTEHKLAVDELGRMGRSICCTFQIASSVTGSAGAQKVKEAFEKFAEGRPQATILFGSPIKDSAIFLMHFWTDPRTAGGVLLVPSALQPFVILRHRELVKRTGSFVPLNMIATGTNPLANDDGFDAMKRFRKDMRNYLSKSGQSDFKDNDDVFLKNGVDGEMMVGGWLAGKILMQALSTLEWEQGKAAFVSSLYKQRRYVVDDLVIGDFGDKCSNVAATQGAICECNQGGKTVFMKKITGDYHVLSLPDGMISFPPTDCFTKNTRLRSPLNSAVLHLEDNARAREVSSLMSIGIRAAWESPDVFGKPVEFLLTPVATRGTSAVDELQHTLLEKDVDALVGFAPKEVLGTGDLMVISPVFERPRLNVYYRHVISILPTVQQQFFTLAHYLQTTHTSGAHALIRSDEGEEMVDVLHKSLETFDVLLRSSRVLSDEEALDGVMPGAGDVFVVGLTAMDVPVIAAYLESRESSRVAILFEDLCQLYSELVAAFTGKGVAHRLLFVTNLPHWADKGAESKTGEMFFHAVPNETLRTPLAMAGFVTARFAHHASAHLVVVNSTTFLNFIYATPRISFDDMLYGPFLDSSKCDTDGKANPNACQVNFGATYMAVWSMARSLNSSVSPLSGGEVPSLQYRLSASEGLTRNQTIALIVGCIIGFLLILSLVVFVSFRCVSNKRNYCAPKDSERPVTLIFTDIQSSTALWAMCPEIMPDAVETHHRLIRRLIAKHGCYEVKTVGDSFMIACKNPYAALQLAGDLQRTFLEHDWGTSAIDEAYREFEEHWAEDDADYEPPTARLDAAVYRAHWRGLRVRAGVHTGLSDIRHDAVTKRFDYYGSVANTAARTESIANGGQVLLTRAAFMALKSTERAELDVTSLGAVELRGVPKPVEVLQLNAVPGRTFAKLRLERGNDEFDFDTSTAGGTDTSGSESEALSPAGENIYTVFKDSLSPFPPRERMKLLEPFCKKWHVTMPAARNAKELFAACHLTEQRLAMKVSRVMERRQLTHGGTLGLSETISSRRSYSSQNSSKLSLSRRNSLSKNSISKRPQTGERPGGSPFVTFIPFRDSCDFSSTSSIHVGEPSFFSHAWA